MTDNCFILFSTFLVFFYEISRGSGVGWYFYIDGDVEGMERSQARGACLLQSPRYPYLMQDSLMKYTQGPQVHQRAHS